MNQGQAGWILLLLFAIMMIVIGVQGSLGLVVAILFCPYQVSTEE